MRLEIITPVKVLYNDEVTLVRVPGEKGSFEILKGHASIISSLSKGEVKVIDANKNSLFFEIEGGVVECKSDQIIVLANNGNPKEGID
ncbi:MAG TPA: ATP synthase F1 subunit epsilon [Prolixibacteraceae bacterium]|nr:ATP synthase F1 subunit epsilon [Prolixibacteraceae bacterium]HPS13338.1 ATP synthase F1 subunit epsilon [Prolixibacteraceae bacterium]